MSEEAVGAQGTGNSGMPMSLRQGQTNEARIAILEATIEERHRFYMQLFKSQESAAFAAIASQREAIVKAEIANERRFESVNEFRGQLNDIISTLMPRNESTGRYQALSEKVDQMQTRIDKQEGAGSGMKQSWTVLVGGVAALATMISIFAVVSKQAPSAETTAVKEAAAANAANAQLAARMDAMSARINALTPLQTK